LFVFGRSSADSSLFVSISEIQAGQDYGRIRNDLPAASRREAHWGKFHGQRGYSV
jgi:hypothetical protein